MDAFGQHAVRRASQFIAGGGQSHGSGSFNAPALGDFYAGSMLAYDPRRKTVKGFLDGAVDQAIIYDSAGNALKSVLVRNLATKAIQRNGSISNLITNNNTEVTIFSATIPAGMLTANGACRFNLASGYLNNSGAGQIATLRLKLNGTTVYSDPTAAVAASAGRRTFLLRGFWGNSGIANAQYGGFSYELSTGNAATGLGSIGNQSLLSAAVGFESAIDTTAIVTFDITWQFTNANANLQLQNYHAHAEII